MKSIVPLEVIEQKILLVKGRKVMLDGDLATLYGVTTKRLNEQVRRNLKRFPQDFMYQLSDEEFESLRSHFATLKRGSCFDVANCDTIFCGLNDLPLRGGHV